jgi:polar amino acid transport system substrate-binding protein
MLQGCLRWARLIAMLVTAVFILSAIPTVQAQDDSLDRVKKQGLRVGFQGEEPFSFLDSSGKFAGVEADFVTTCATRLGIKQVTPVQTAWDGLIPGLLAGRWDVIAAGMALTPERAAVALPIDPTYFYAEVPFVRKGNPKGIHSVNDLISKDVRIGVLSGTADVLMLPKLGVPKEKLVLFDELNSMLLALDQDRVDAMMDNTISGNRFIQRTQSKTIEMADPWTFVPEMTYKSTMYLRKEDKTLWNSFNSCMSELKKDGTVKSLLEKWGIGAQFILR